MFTSTKQLLNHALKNGYAIGAFNIFNLESAQAVIRAAIKKKSPVIINVTPKATNYAGITSIVNILKSVLADEKPRVKNIPFALQLDHGKTFDDVTKAIQSGFTSVMLDGSRLPYEENLALTKKVAKYAHERKASVQGELGAVPYQGEEKLIKKWEDIMTDPSLAKDFIKETKIDALAVAIGNAHGLVKERGELDFERLKKISQLVNVPLVLHGASDFPVQKISEAISRGVASFHIDTDLKIAFSSAIKEIIAKSPEIYDPRQILEKGRNAMQKVVEEKIEIFGSARKMGDPSTSLRAGPFRVSSTA